MGIAAASVLAVLLTAYVFWPSRSVTLGHRKSRLDYLRERRDVIYENLRDLSFEYGAGKHPEADFQRQRASLENEAANLLAEMDVLESLEQRFGAAPDGR